MKVPMMTFREGIDAYFKKLERQMKGCEALGLEHEYIRPSYETVLCVDKDRKVVGDVSMIMDPRVVAVTPGMVWLDHYECAHCQRRPPADWKAPEEKLVTYGDIKREKSTPSSEVK